MKRPACRAEVERRSAFRYHAEEAGSAPVAFCWPKQKTEQLLLPEGGAGRPLQISPPLRGLKEACDKASKVKDMKWDEQTRQILRQIYSELSKDQPGMFGCVVARSEAQVLRLTFFLRCWIPRQSLTQYI